MIAGIALFLLLVGMHPRAMADTRPEDLPPPPGALEHELGLAPADRAPAVAPDKINGLGSPIEIPFLLEGGHIIIDASIDGLPPKPFMFDTGARHMITPDTARLLTRTTAVRTARAAGIGPKISQIEMIKVGRIAIGSATLDEPTVGVLDIPNIIVDRGARPRLAGLIGSELLSRYVVTIDYGRHLLIFNSPGFRPSSVTFSLPLGLAMSPDGLSHPSIAAELGGVAGNFSIDTGSGGQLFLSDRFEQANKPFMESGTTLHFLSPGGIGGRLNVRMGFGKRLRIGPFELASPVMMGPDDGGAALTGIAGIIGNAVLSNFIVTIDVPAGRVHFQAVAARPLVKSIQGVGLILDKPDHEAFEVLDVLKGTAAERAGLRRGDRIVEIGGRPARDLGYRDIHMLDFAPVRSSITVRTSDQRRLDLTYSRLLP